jgi:Rod binding domain-containing protein
VARDFEAIFLSHLLRQMREATAQRGIFQAGGGLRTYQGIADDEFGRALARAGGIGLAATLGRELRRLVPAPAGGSSRAAIRPMIFPDAALPPSGGPP